MAHARHTTIATPATTTTLITTTPATKTPTPFFARMGITYESWLEMLEIGSKRNKFLKQGRVQGNRFVDHVGRKNFENMISIKQIMNAHSRKIDSGEIQGVKPGPCGKELKAHWSCRDDTRPTTMTTPETTPATTTTPITTTPATTTQTPFFARMGITYESWLEMNAIGSTWNKDPNQGYSFIARVGRKDFEKMVSIQQIMNAHSRKIDSGEIQGVKPGPCGLELKAHWSCRDDRTPATATTITPATTTTPGTTTTPTTTTTPIPTTPATTKPLTIIKKTAEVTDEEVDFLKKTIDVVVASTEEGMTKYQLAKSIYHAIRGKKGSWSVVIASTQSASTHWSFFVYAVQHKLIELQLGDNLQIIIWKAKM